MRATCSCDRRSFRDKLSARYSAAGCRLEKHASRPRRCTHSELSASRSICVLRVTRQEREGSALQPCTLVILRTCKRVE